jgi:hypothetical protein
MRNGLLGLVMILNGPVVGLPNRRAEASEAAGKTPRDTPVTRSMITQDRCDFHLKEL